MPVERAAIAGVMALLVLAACASEPRVQIDAWPQPGYGAFLAGPGHVNPEDPGLPNGGGD